jgi:hypothetical protein
VSNFYAGTSVNPIESRKKLWAKLASAAGFTEPFSLTPDLIYRVVGAPRAAKFRSAEQYLDVAFTEHVNRGFPVTSQLLLASKRANRAAKRNRGPGKQAAALPLSRLGDLQQVDPFHSRGPAYPGRATRIASWRLL